MSDKTGLLYVWSILDAPARIAVILQVSIWIVLAGLAGYCFYRAWRARRGED